MPHSQQRAIAHVTTLATGEPADPSLRVTLHFHPDRLVSWTPILDAWRVTGCTGRSSRPVPATAA